MEPVVAVVIVAMFALVPAGVAAVFFIGNVRRETEREAMWRRLAQRLGMGFGHGRIDGLLNGQYVALRVETRPRRFSSVAYTVVSTAFLPSLDLGLVVRHQDTVDDFVRAFGGGKDHEVGDSAFDRACVVNADEHLRVAQLLTPKLREVLLAIDKSDESYLLTDAGLCIECLGVIADERWLEWLLRAVAEVARLVNEARSTVLPATPLLAYRGQFRRYAAESGFSEVDMPLCMSGRMNGVDVFAYATRTGPLQYQLEITVKFEEPLRRGLLVQPAGTFDAVGHLLGGADHDLGDDAFDRAFTVSGADRDEIARIVDADVRRRLFDLNQRVGRVELRDDGLSLRLPSLGRPELVPILVDHARMLVARVARNARLGRKGPAGPYR